MRNTEIYFEITTPLGIKIRTTKQYWDYLINIKQEYFKSEDEIITTPFTFVATADTILLSGAAPVFVDIDPYTYNINYYITCCT